MGDAEYNALPESNKDASGFVYMVKVYANGIMSLVIPVSKEQLWHVAIALMTGIHYVFPPDDNVSNDQISKKKLMKNTGQ